jgi:CheY-like chemotaxis protein
MRRILVVDDDLHVRLAVRTWLKRCGFRVATARSDQQGATAPSDISKERIATG